MKRRSFFAAIAALPLFSKQARATLPEPEYIRPMPECAPPAPPPQSTTVVVHLQGDLFKRDVVRMLVEQLDKEVLSTGGRIIVR